jgi:hypothetical protein
MRFSARTELIGKAQKLPMPSRERRDTLWAVNALLPEVNGILSRLAADLLAEVDNDPQAIARLTTAVWTGAAGGGCSPRLPAACSTCAISAASSRYR